MRKRWNRATALIELSLAELSELTKEAFPGHRVISAEFAEGGLANTNIKVHLADVAEPALVRLYVRDAAQAKKEFRILSMVQDRVRVPRVYSFSEQCTATEHPVMVMQFVQGSTLESRLEDLDVDSTSSVALSIGESLAHIHSFQFPSAGFFDQELKVATEVTICGAGLVDYANECLYQKGGASVIGEELTERVITFLERERRLIDDWTVPACLTHSDFGPSNMLVQDFEVAAVLDWEFAFSGSPFFDFGNLLRAPVEQIPGFVDALVAGYRGAGGELPSEWRRMSLLVDLTAWFEFSTRPNIGQELAEDARTVIKETMLRFV